MIRHLALLSIPALLVAALAQGPAGSAPVQTPGLPAPLYDVRAFGAKGDGTAIDTPAIDAAIEAAAAAGGGTVYFAGGHLRELLDPPEESHHAPTRRRRHPSRSGAIARSVGGTTCPSRTNTTSTRTSATATGRTA